MADTTDLTRAIIAARHFENILKERYRAWGNGLGGKARSVSRKLPPDVLKHLLYIAEVSNKMRHEKVDSLPDERRFEDACTALEQFFKEPIREHPSKRSWLEPLPLQLWPTRADSSAQKRLFTVSLGSVKIYPPGSYWLSNAGRTVQAGYVCMLPMSIDRFEARPLRSQDDLFFGIALDLSLAIVDQEDAIAAVVLAEDEQIEITQMQVLNVLQRLCAEKPYASITGSLTELADNVMRTVNDMVTQGRGGVFTIKSCAIVACELDDPDLADIWPERRRLAELARKQAEEERHMAELRKAKAEFEREQERAAAAHEVELASIKAEQERLQQQLLKEKALLEQELARNKLEVERVKAEIANLPAGKHVLYPELAFGIDRQRLIRDAEVLRATLTDRKLQVLLELAAQAGFTQAQVQSLERFVSQIAGITLTEKPPSEADWTEGSHKRETEGTRQKGNAREQAEGADSGGNVP